MPRFAARIEHVQLRGRLRPGVEGAGGRVAVVEETQVGHLHRQGLSTVATNPPSTERVVE